MTNYLNEEELEALAYLVDEVKDTARFLTLDKAETREDIARLWGDLDYLKEQLEKALDLTRSHL
jgi:hypothetical protein